MGGYRRPRSEQKTTETLSCRRRLKPRRPLSAPFKGPGEVGGAEDVSVVRARGDLGGATGQERAGCPLPLPPGSAPRRAAL